LRSINLLIDLSTVSHSLSEGKRAARIGKDNFGRPHFGSTARLEGFEDLGQGAEDLGQDAIGVETK
jgi:hypothetical protein